jgi:hypothetical protein
VWLPDGSYADVLTGQSVLVRRGKVALPEGAVIVRYGAELDLQPIYSELLDYDFREEPI